jgi:S1-C subfamily serine protease
LAIFLPIRKANTQRSRASSTSSLSWRRALFFADPLGYQWTFTQGIISAVRAIDAGNQHYTAIQTQTPINPGNLGGPLLNSNSEVVGINTWVRDVASVDKRQINGELTSATRPAQGLNFAVSAPDIRSFPDDIGKGKFSALQILASATGCQVK